MSNEILELVNNDQRMEEMKNAALDNAGRFVIDRVGKYWINFFEEEILK